MLSFVILLSPPSSATMESIAERLSEIEGLYFPQAIQPSAISPSQRKSILLDLLCRDVAVFLERYGSQLTLEELESFDGLKDDYEVNWHLKHLRSLMSPSEEEIKLRSVKMKNRRRAYMDKLMVEGEYFSEDAMREREPYLHHEYVGKFQDPLGRNMARPGERWSDTLMRRSEEAVIVAKIREEQHRLGVAESEWVGHDRVQLGDQGEPKEEVETDDEEEVEDEVNAGPRSPEVLADHGDTVIVSQTTTAEQYTHEVSLSAEEMQDRMDQFTHIMQDKFLTGEDQEHLDYSKIDEDETLDEYWLKEVNQDAEEKYFAED